MASLTIAWEYLTGYSVATDPTTRDRAEWPPHPARVFMALVAAWAETEPREESDGDRQKWLAEREALLWLETLDDPEMRLPKLDDGSERSNVTFYVPVNDKAGPSASTLQSYPELTRSKQARSFPRRWVGDRSCFLDWPRADGVEIHRDALERLCRKVTRLGHSSSLVSMRVADETEVRDLEGWTHLVPDKLRAKHRVRSVSEGMLGMLQERFGDQARRQHAALGQRLGDLKLKKKGLVGKEAKEARDAMDKQIQVIEEELSDLVPRPPVRPTTGLWSGYRERNGQDAPPDVVQTVFDPDLLVLTRIKGPPLPVVSTLTITKALRNKILRECAEPVPDWVSGHLPNRQPLRDGNQHMALIPLPYVGSEHADGHLLGVAIVLPRSLDLRACGRVLGKVFLDANGQANPVTLDLKSLGQWEIQKRGWEESRQALDPNHWTGAVDSRGARQGATRWASVTPVVLDRFPKHDRNHPEERQAWEYEVDQILRESCTRIGLPEPELIDTETTSWHLGSPRAIGKRRLLRGQNGPEGQMETAFGDGFPPYPPKGTNAPRPQVHVWLQFARPVIGPVLLGAGRFLGYGLFKPLPENRG